MVLEPESGHNKSQVWDGSYVNSSSWDVALYVEALTNLHDSWEPQVFTDC